MFGGEPHITVSDVYEQVQEGESVMNPTEFADTFRLNVIDVYHAHPDEMKYHRETRASASEILRERSANNQPADIDHETESR